MYGFSMICFALNKDRLLSSFILFYLLTMLLLYWTHYRAVSIINALFSCALCEKSHFSSPTKVCYTNKYNLFQHWISRHLIIRLKLVIWVIIHWYLQFVDLHHVKHHDVGDWHVEYPIFLLFNKAETWPDKFESECFRLLLIGPEMIYFLHGHKLDSQPLIFILIWGCVLFNKGFLGCIMVWIFSFLQIALKLLHDRD